MKEEAKKALHKRVGSRRRSSASEETVQTRLYPYEYLSLYAEREGFPTFPLNMFLNKYLKRQNSHLKSSMKSVYNKTGKMALRQLRKAKRFPLVPSVFDFNISTEKKFSPKYVRNLV